MRSIAILILSVVLFSSGEATAASFTDNRDGTVTDNLTSLMWQKQDDKEVRTWKEAITYCEKLYLAGYSDWRLPTIKELGSIVDNTTVNPAIDTTYFPGTVSSYYWSTTTYADGTASAWNVNFYDGYVASFSKTSVYYARCVR